MYNIAFFENGRFATHIGGPVQTLTEALAQVQRLSSGLNATELKDYVGFKYDRYGTPCAVLIMDRWGIPIQSAEEVCDQ